MAKLENWFQLATVCATNFPTLSAATDYACKMDLRSRALLGLAQYRAMVERTGAQAGRPKPIPRFLAH
jgi:hypothetical protein